MNQYNLNAIVQTIAPVLAGKACTVRMSAAAQTASTDGKLVILPTFCRNGTESDAKVLRGFLAHEIVGHVRHTEFAQVHFAAVRKAGGQLGAGLLNIIEDVRIERAAWRVFPKSRKLLAECCAVLDVERQFFTLPRSAVNQPAQVLTCLLLNDLRERLLGQVMTQANVVRAAAVRLFGKSLVAQILAIAEKGALSSSTGEVVGSVLDLLALMKSTLKQAEKQQKQKQDDDQTGQQGGEGDDDQTGQQGGEGDDDQTGQQGGEGDDDQTGQQGGEGDDDQTGQQGGEGDDDQTGQQGGEDDDQTGQQGGAGDDQTGQQGGAGGGKGRSHGADRDLDSIIKALQETLSADDVGRTELSEAIESLVQSGYGSDQKALEVYRCTHVAYPDWKPSELALAQARKVASQLARLLESKTFQESRFGREGRLCGRLLPRIRTRDFDVFEEEGAEVEGLDTAVSIVLDNSGSMNDQDNIGSGIAACWAAAEAMSRHEQDGVAFSIYTFSTATVQYKSFDERWRCASKRLSTVRASGGTRFYGALLGVVPEIAVRREKRKIILMITDGDVGETDAATIETLRKQGIEVRAIFIGAADMGAKMKDYFTKIGIKHFGHAAKTTDIASSVIGALKDVF